MSFTQRTGLPDNVQGKTVANALLPPLNRPVLRKQQQNVETLCAGWTGWP